MEENVFLIENDEAVLEERCLLAAGRIASFPGTLEDEALRAYFTVLREFVLACEKERKELKRDRTVNALLFRDLEEERYPGSWLDPAHAVREAGAVGQLLAVWYAECLSLVASLYERKTEFTAAVLETTIQIFNIFEQDDIEDKEQAVRSVIYDYLYDYAAVMTADHMTRNADPDCHFAYDILMNADLTDTGDHSWLYSYGERITKEETGTAQLMASLPESVIEEMARAYTEGYIRGFAMTGKDITRKSTVLCYLPLGFDRFMRAAVRQFEAAGLKVILNRRPVHLINARFSGNVQPGFYGAINSRFAFDHREDLALFWGDKLKACRLQARSQACAQLKEKLGQLSGHACVEIFGVSAGTPEQKPEAPAFNAHQLEVTRAYLQQDHELMEKYMPEEETSYTIIAWPTPSAADAFSAMTGLDLKDAYRMVFEKLVEINTLPAGRWQMIQQDLIDALDQAEYVEVRGCGGNETDIRVMLHSLSDPSAETNFENCLADVNIPAGEVFTTPVLAGTAGLLHVGHVYIEGYLFRDLKIRFEDGRVQSYECANSSDPEEGRRLIRKVIFHDREQLPLGEFAIGTNTTAFITARRYCLEEKMPVLIAEKTGPHFAVGDTCYSYEEDIAAFNPDGKRIAARENECSVLRHSASDQAYFHVHTDITLPYEELGSVTAVFGEKRIDLIRDGRFVLPGTEELNRALQPEVCGLGAARNGGVS
ncbi:MAG: aminopeptidase [Lachnospiraceae bacterium]|nr:aminopeptidase [Lachnospiraceae bacterium]